MIVNSDVKFCAACGRRFEWRSKWAAVWDKVRYCSKGCRSHKPGSSSRRLEEAMLSLLAKLGRGATICSDDAAREVFGADWSAHAQEARRAARRLVAAGRLEIIQQGRVVDPSTARGPIQLRLAG